MLPSPLQLDPMALGSNRFLLSQSKFVSQDSFQSPGKQVWRTRSERQWKGDWNSGLQVGWRGCTAGVGVLGLLKGVCRPSCLPLKRQQTGQDGGKESLLCFRFWQLLGEGGRHLSKGQLPPPPPREWGESFYRQRGAVATCRNRTVISNSHLQIGHQWSDQHHLDCFQYR